MFLKNGIFILASIQNTSHQQKVLTSSVIHNFLFITHTHSQKRDQLLFRSRKENIEK